MSDIKLGTSGDIDLTNGAVSLTSGVTSASQRIAQRLRFFYSEWFLDRTRGVPYIQQVFVKRPNPVVIDAIFKNEILADPAVIELKQFALDLDTATRVLTITFKALTSDGLIDFSEAFET